MLGLATTCTVLLWAGCSSSAGPTTGSGGDNATVDASFLVRNDSSEARTQTVFVSVPFPEGAVQDLNKVGITGKATAWRPLQRWRDGSVRVAQAQFTDTFEPLTTQTYQVTGDERAATGSFEAHPWTRKADGKWAFVPEVVDTDGVSYYGLIQDEGKVLHESRFERTKFWRVYLYNVNKTLGIQRDFLAARFYVTTYRDMPFANVGLAIGSDYRGADQPGASADPNLHALGAVEFRKLMVHCTGASSRMRQREKHAVAEPVFDAQRGTETHTLLEDTWFDDGQTKFWSFLMFFEDTGAPASERDQWRRTRDSDLAHPMRPLASLKTWQKSDAMGCLGGPSTGPANSYELAEAEYVKWANQDHFGPFGGWGDVLYTYTTGAPRNTPVSPELAHAIQGENPRLLEKLEGMAWQQSLRQYHLWDLNVKADDDIYLMFSLTFGLDWTSQMSTETLGRAVFWRNGRTEDPYAHWRQGIPSGSGARGHGWNAWDDEHVTCDILFDHYTVTGCDWTRDELRMFGDWTKGCMRLKTYATAHSKAARIEGWVMQAYAQVYLATEDETIKEHAVRRVDELVEPGRHKDHPSRALHFTGSYPSTRFPEGTGFYMPWQHSALIYGYLAGYQVFGSETALKICEDVVHLCEYVTLENWTNPLDSTEVVKFALRYYVPGTFTGTYNNQNYNNYYCPPDFFDRDPAIGAHVGGYGTTGFFKSALYLLAETTKDSSIRARTLTLAGKILGQPRPDRMDFWDKWTCQIPDDVLK